ncbi:Conserved_hypothetical protein [Hexamita inflata]|uniref:Exonuclease domain-containing protein n=1 Tax=Hexamita inflata TaxID=28002 RepID=A0ABP1GFK4_9EUKA
MKTKQANITGSQLTNLVTKNTSLIFIDFEAFSTDPLYPSEIGCVRVQNGQLVATLHTFICPLNFDQIIGTKVETTFVFTKGITGIPVPWSNEFQQCQPCVKYDQNLLQFGQLLIQFCIASSQVLRNGLGKDINVQIFSEFEQNNDYVFLAKGIDLENNILSNMMGIENKVVESDYIHKKFFRKAMTFENLHSDRNFDYCEFHKKVPNKKIKKMKHCALDDALYLANQFVYSFKVSTTAPCMAVIQTKVIYQDDEIIIEW